MKHGHLHALPTLYRSAPMGRRVRQYGGPRSSRRSCGGCRPI